ncbi:hypothetical protein IPG41_00075 [Candidatus Peregrinibacteria bacterium]|nr:MAG: hypothetical protein IPG41_00075 [Candidatus Peregrinibacteria bacterium]
MAYKDDPSFQARKNYLKQEGFCELVNAYLLHKNPTAQAISPENYKGTPEQNLAYLQAYLNFAEKYRLLPNTGGVSPMSALEGKGEEVPVIRLELGVIEGKAPEVAVPEVTVEWEPKEGPFIEIQPEDVEKVTDLDGNSYKEPEPKGNDTKQEGEGKKDEGKKGEGTEGEEKKEETPSGETPSGETPSGETPEEPEDPEATRETRKTTNDAIQAPFILEEFDPYADEEQLPVGTKGQKKTIVPETAEAIESMNPLKAEWESITDKFKENYPNAGIQVASLEEVQLTKDQWSELGIQNSERNGIDRENSKVVLLKGSGGERKVFIIVQEGGASYLDKGVTAVIERGPIPPRYIRGSQGETITYLQAMEQISETEGWSVLTGLNLAAEELGLERSPSEGDQEAWADPWKVISKLEGYAMEAYTSPSAGLLLRLDEAKEELEKHEVQAAWEKTLGADLATQKREEALKLIRQTELQPAMLTVKAGSTIFNKIVEKRIEREINKEDKKPKQENEQ